MTNLYFVISYFVCDARGNRRQSITLKCGIYILPDLLCVKVEFSNFVSSVSQLYELPECSSGRWLQVHSPVFYVHSVGPKHSQINKETLSEQTVTSDLLFLLLCATPSPALFPFHHYYLHRPALLQHCLCCIQTLVTKPVLLSDMTIELKEKSG